MCVCVCVLVGKVTNSCWKFKKIIFKHVVCTFVAVVVGVVGDMLAVTY